MKIHRSRNDVLNEHIQQELRTLDQYMRSRLALAYILNEQRQPASEILQELEREEITSEPIRYLVEALRSTTDNPLLACLAAYDVFTEHYPQQIYGVVRKQLYGHVDYLPEHMGCDASTMIQNTILASRLENTVSPIVYLQNLRLPIYDSVNSDLNGDGQAEWLIWLDSLMPPFFFVAEDNTYEVSRPQVDPYHTSEGITLLSLPGEAGTGLVYLRPAPYFFYYIPWELAYDPVGGMGGGFSRCNTGNESQMSIWRMDADELISIFYNMVCRDDFSLLFPEGQGSTILDGGEITFTDWNDLPVVRSLIFIWDETTQTYLDSFQAANPEATPTPEPEAEQCSISYTPPLSNDDYECIINSTENILSADLSEEDPYEIALTSAYRRALALEALDRPDEALMEYVAIYEAAPQSAWGMLAALHIETNE